MKTQYLILAALLAATSGQAETFTATWEHPDPAAVLHYRLQYAFDGSFAPGIDPELFRSYRYDPPAAPEMGYTLPLSNGAYLVSLYFAETWSGAFGPGKRVFDVFVEGKLALDNLDIYAEVGANTQLVKTVRTEVADGNLNIDFAHVTENPVISAIQAASEDGAPVLRLNVGGVDHPAAEGPLWLADDGFNTGKVSSTSALVAPLDFLSAGAPVTTALSFDAVAPVDATQVSARVAACNSSGCSDWLSVTAPLPANVPAKAVNIELTITP